MAINVGGASAVNNFGTILATGAQGVGVFMSQGALTNGSLNNGVARIDGYTGAILFGSSVSTNFGTISGSGDAGGFGLELATTESLVNGAAGHQGAVVEGFSGVYAFGSANTVTNFGTIIGTAGTALDFNNAADVLIVEAGCAFSARCWAAAGRSIWTPAWGP